MLKLNKTQAAVLDAAARRRDHFRVRPEGMAERSAKALGTALLKLGLVAEVQGEINHKGRSHPGEHAPIVTPELFEAVQQKLAANLNGHRLKRASSQALLIGRIFDDRGNRMTPSHAKKNGARYRYYVSCVPAQGRKAEAGSLPRVPAPEIEAAVVAALRQPAEDSGPQDHWSGTPFGRHHLRGLKPRR